MQYGYCVNMLADISPYVGSEKIPMIKQLGFDYVELPLAQLMVLDQREFEMGLLKILHEEELPCKRCNNFLPPNYRITGDFINEKQLMLYVKKALRRVKQLGADVIVLGSAEARNVPDGFPMKRAKEQFKEWTTVLADLAYGEGITFVIESLNAGESNFINHFMDSLVLAQEIDHPGIAVLADYYHMKLAGDPVTDLFSAEGMLRHVHIAQPLHRQLPSKGDHEPYDVFFDTLKKIGYGDTISIEAFMLQTDTEKEVAEALEYLRMIERTV